MNCLFIALAQRLVITGRRGSRWCQLGAPAVPGGQGLTRTTALHEKKLLLNTAKSETWDPSVLLVLVVRLPIPNLNDIRKSLYMYLELAGMHEYDP